MEICIANQNSGGGAFGYSAGIQGGFKHEEEASEVKTDSNEKKQMTITYNVSASFS